MNYKEVYSQETVDKIEELIADYYCLEDIVEFIDANSEAVFRSYYQIYVEIGEEFIDANSEAKFRSYNQIYVEIGEEYSYGAVDAFIEEFGLHTFTSSGFEDSYRGQYDSKAQDAENYVSDCYSVDLPGFLEIDWEATFENLDVVFSSNGYVFDNQF